ncbi:hypothetical protein FGG08_002107 [Glutinoglossum americanum]|uniref:S-adenosyl-L-methionine-dependent methyltransferase n=1 Tax=Glutinoglossum americanum TaxID=1670608 RepID=A0A9P8IDE8_9PEZI|nr:hypothetical protein FGG08_002107 [Glutinoglossum americanum]
MTRPESYNFQFENGRRYHAFHAGEYLCLTTPFVMVTKRRPNDQKQIEAERIADFATKYPSAAVLGMDLSPIQDVFIPPNLRFEIVDFCDVWSYSESTFDLIFLRGLDGSVLDWPRLYTEVYRALKPGAYIEHSEICIELKSDDETITPEHIFGRWGNTLLEASYAHGKPLGIANQTKELMEVGGFVEIVERRFEWPIGRWSQGEKLRQFGRLNRKHWKQSIEGWSIALLTRALKWSIPQVREFLREMEEGLKDTNIHAYHEV